MQVCAFFASKSIYGITVVTWAREGEDGEPPPPPSQPPNRREPRRTNEHQQRALLLPPLYYHHRHHYQQQQLYHYHRRRHTILQYHTTRPREDRSEARTSGSLDRSHARISLKKITFYLSFTDWHFSDHTNKRNGNSDRNETIQVFLFSLSLFYTRTRTFLSRVVALPRRERNVSRWDTNTGTRQDTDTDTENRLLRPSANVCAATNLDVARAQRRTERFERPVPPPFLSPTSTYFLQEIKQKKEQNKPPVHHQYITRRSLSLN